MRHWRIILFIFLTIFVANSCQTPGILKPTPLPGWRSPVYLLLIDDSDLPDGWVVNLAESIDSTDPTTNHVSRSWYYPGRSARVSQSIWRAYSVHDAESKYENLRNSQFDPSRELFPGTIYVEFEPPTEIDYQSQIADDYYLACGWLERAYCVMIARYRNYVVEIWAEREAELNAVQVDGMTYEEIETLIKAMDAKLDDFLKSDIFQTPSPE